ncbi:ureidoglycolate dehydrogenase [Fundicoccus culcitae]|uniref:Ureidoglycolate dehydrogenase n=1 Tax=Fundicoccus culcitae TaxID=2969821 RepID=A0ABY5P9P5_9LACT|nr:ureidoglycolate dehydrogenase [Fundicoccus culcitae]UUX35320.1 ureidoglycolate dehydrogenase [Fundicoccus culcitae]
MTEETKVNITAERLHKLIKDKLVLAGLPEEQAEETSNHLVYADMIGVHSHGAVRVEYYSERISKGGINTNPQLEFEQTGPSTAIYHGDNGQGHFVVNKSLEDVIRLAKESGVAVVGISRVGHTGTLSYYLRKIAKQDLIGIAVTQSDPMVVPYGGAEVYYGTNPIAFSAPTAGNDPIVFDMATTVQAWGKILDARSKGNEIPDTWAVDASGTPTTDPHNVAGLVPIAGPKGYGLMMMVDILAGVLLGLPFGSSVSSMYHDLSEKRNLGQTFIVIDPSRFRDIEAFKNDITQTIDELHNIPTAPGFDQVYYPGELSLIAMEKSQNEGIDIPKSIIDYLESNEIFINSSDHKGIFAD